MNIPRNVSTPPASPPTTAPRPTTPANNAPAQTSGTAPASETTPVVAPPETLEAHETHQANQQHGTSGTESHEHHGGVRPLVELSQTTGASHGDLSLGFGARAGIQGHFGSTGGGHYEAFGTGRVFGNNGSLSTGVGLGVHAEYVFRNGFLTEAHAGAERVSDGHHSSIDFHGEARAGWQFKPGNTEINLTGGAGVAAHGGHSPTPFAVGGIETEFAQNRSVRPFVQADVQVDTHGAVTPQLTVGFRFR